MPPSQLAADCEDAGDALLKVTTGQQNMKRYWFLKSIEADPRVQEDGDGDPNLNDLLHEAYGAENSDEDT